VIARLARGEDVDPALYYFRTFLRFEAGHDSVAWLNKVMAVGRGRREARAVHLAVHEVL
jgi:hypothetical protein